MLDRQLEVAPERPDLQVAPPKQVYTVADARRFLVLRRWAILVPLVLSIAAAYGYLQVAQPSYTARAQIIIDPRLPQFIPGHNEETVLAWDSAQVESEIAVLQSERIAAAVVTKLGLDRDKDFRASPSLLTRARSLLGWTNAPDEKPDRFRDAVNLIQDGLWVRRTGLSYAIDITFSFPDAFRTSEIANAVAEAYITDQIENRSQAARVGGDWLQDRMGSLRSQMNLASKAVQIFRASHNYVIAKPDPGEGAAGAEAAAAAKPEDKTLDELEASALTYRRIYESFLQSYTESVQRQSFPVSDARILTSATLPKIRSAPRTGLIYALAGLLGGLSGFGLAMLRHHLDRAVRSPFQITGLCTLADLGSLPSPRGGVPGALWRIRWGKRGSGSRRSAPVDNLQFGRTSYPVGRGPYLFATLDQRDPGFARALKGVRTLIGLAGRHDAVRCLGVTALDAGAASSILAGNLASLSASCGMRTLLVDADGERRRLTRQFGRRVAFGLHDVLAGTATIDQAIIGLDDAGLDVLPAAAAGTARNRGCDLTMERMGALLQDLAGRYDLVVVDLPPLLPVGETLDLSGALDGIVLAVDWGRTHAERVAEGASHLARAYARPLGFVLNNVGW